MRTNTTIFVESYTFNYKLREHLCCTFLIIFERNVLHSVGFFPRSFFTLYLVLDRFSIEKGFSIWLDHNRPNFSLLSFFVSDNRPGCRFRLYMDICRPVHSLVGDTRPKQFYCWNVCFVCRRSYYAHYFNFGLLWFIKGISLHVNDGKSKWSIWTKSYIKLSTENNISQFFCFLLLILVAEIAAGAWAIHNKSVLDDMFRATVKNTVQNEYGVIQMKTDSFDTFQRQVSSKIVVLQTVAVIWKCGKP